VSWCEGVIRQFQGAFGNSFECLWTFVEVQHRLGPLRAALRILCHVAGGSQYTCRGRIRLKIHKQQPKRKQCGHLSTRSLIQDTPCSSQPRCIQCSSCSEKKCTRLGAAETRVRTMCSLCLRCGSLTTRSKENCDESTSCGGAEKKTASCKRVQER